MKKPNDYVDNEKLHAEMVEYIKAVRITKEAKAPLPPINNYIGSCILRIAQGLAMKGNFSQYTYKDEMISDGVENCILYIHNYNPDISKNAFSYFTFIIFRAFLRRIAKEKKHQYIKQKSLIKSVYDKSYFTTEESSGNLDNEVDLDMNMDFASEFVKNYEKKLEEERLKSKKKSEIENG